MLFRIALTADETTGQVTLCLLQSSGTVLSTEASCVSAVSRRVFAHCSAIAPPVSAPTPLCACRVETLLQDTEVYIAGGRIYGVPPRQAGERLLGRQEASQPVRGRPAVWVTQGAAKLAVASTRAPCTLVCTSGSVLSTQYEDRAFVLVAATVHNRRLREARSGSTNGSGFGAGFCNLRGGQKSPFVPGHATLWRSLLCVDTAGSAPMADETMGPRGLVHAEERSVRHFVGFAGESRRLLRSLVLYSPQRREGCQA